MGSTKRPRTSGPVYDVLFLNLGNTVHIDDLVKETKLTRLQIQNAIWNLQARNGVVIKVIVRGHSWVMTTADTPPDEDFEEAPVAAPKKGFSLFEEVGKLEGGATVVRDEEGQLYRLEKM